jgi:hypothetical protein
MRSISQNRPWRRHGAMGPDLNWSRPHRFHRSLLAPNPDHRRRDIRSRSAEGGEVVSNPSLSDGKHSHWEPSCPSPSNEESAAVSSGPSPTACPRSAHDSPIRDVLSPRTSTLSVPMAVPSRGLPKMSQAERLRHLKHWRNIMDRTRPVSRSNTEWHLLFGLPRPLVEMVIC